MVAPHKTPEPHPCDSCVGRALSKTVAARCSQTRRTPPSRPLHRLQLLHRLQHRAGGHLLLDPWRLHGGYIPLRAADSAVPSFSTPNHLFAQSATSCGLDDNINWDGCGGSKASFPQRTIYDNVAEANVSFALSSNRTPHSADFNMDGVQRHRDRVLGYTNFFSQAAAGELPAFSWIMPGADPRNGNPNDDHPCHDVALGERLLKDIYEGLRTGPGWEKTLFLMTYDDAGGW